TTWPSGCQRRSGYRKRWSSPIPSGSSVRPTWAGAAGSACGSTGSPTGRWWRGWSRRRTGRWRRRDCARRSTRGRARRPGHGGTEASPPRRASGGQDAVDELVGARAIDVVQVGVDAVAAGRRQIEALVEDVATAQPAAHEVPGQAEQGGAALGVDAVGPTEEFVDQRTLRGVVELRARGRGEQIVTADHRDDLVDTREPGR